MDTLLNRLIHQFLHCKGLPSVIMKRGGILSVFVIIILVGGISGCASSLVYSPSIQLPVQPLKKDQGQAGFGMVLLPETRPSAVGQKTSIGGEGFLRYAFSNKFSLQGRYWHNLESDNNLFGTSISGTYIFGDSSSSTHYGLTCATAALFSGSSVEGGGSSVIGSVWLPKLSADIRPFCSLGAIIGYRHLNTTPKEWGAGLLLQGGLAWSLSQVWTLHFEGSFITQMNFYEDISHGIPSLSVATSITF